MSIVDPRKVLIDELDITLLKVHYSSEPIILLCGGPVKIKLKADDPDPPVLSLRQAVNTESNTFGLTEDIPEFNLFRPEEIEEWATDAIFKNLMDYEKELASVSSLVVIILESAGSIAELGAFSQLPELSKKLIIFKSNHFGSDTSFIDLGILRYIKSDYGSNKVRKYDWTPSTNGRTATIPNDLALDVLHDLSDEVKGLKKTSKFKPEYDTHIAALICELISIFKMIKEGEIQTYLTTLKININKDGIKRKLFILQHFKIIAKVEVSDSIYYHHTGDEFHSVNGFPTDKLRQSIMIIEYYKSKKDRHRIKAIQSLGEQNE